MRCWNDKPKVCAPSLWLVMLIAAALFQTGCLEKKETKVTPPPREVSIVTVTLRDVPVFSEFVARTQSSQLVNIQARVSGFLEKRMYVEGAVVLKGQMLFQMDDKPFKVQLAQAGAALARQEAALETARRNLDRIRPLVKMNAMSPKDLDNAMGQYQTSAAAVEQAKARVESEKLNLSYTAITSPVTGVSSSQAISDHSQTHHVFYDQTLIRYPFHSAFKRFSGANT